MTAISTEGKIILPDGSVAAGAKLRFKRWTPEGGAKAAVLLSHGYAEHLERYEHVATALVKAGYDVFAVDHWGHGRSDGEPGFVPAFSVYLDGLDALLARVKSAAGGKKRFLIGHSMGGLIAAEYLINRQGEYAGAVLSGPSIKASSEPSPVLLFIGRLLSKFAPKTGVIALDAYLVSRDGQVVADYLADPLVHHGKISARLGAEMTAAMAHVEANAGKLTLPLLLLHGGADGLTSPEGSRLLEVRAQSADKTLKIYEGFFHEIFNDPGKEGVIADMIAWMDARV